MAKRTHHIYSTTMYKLQNQIKFLWTLYTLTICNSNIITIILNQ